MQKGRPNLADLAFGRLEKAEMRPVSRHFKDMGGSSGVFCAWAADSQPFLRRRTPFARDFLQEASTEKAF